MMTMLERAIASAANAVGADLQDLRELATGARLREWQPGGMAVPRIDALQVDGHHRGG
jgi:hypothetical protein